MRILQISKYYLPLIGGQSTYIENLNKIFETDGINSFVLQQYTKEEGRNVLKLKHIPFTWKHIDPWFIFNFQLRFQKRLIRKFDVVISHYPFHYPSLKWHNKLIIISHGLDWNLPPVWKIDKYREYTAGLVRKEKVFLVSNDTHFLRHLGYDIKAKTNYFDKINDYTWFIPNCIDTQQFFDRQFTRQNLILVPRTICPQRGIHLAILAFVQFIKNHPDYSMKILGSYSKTWSYFKYCKKIIEENNLAEKVTIEGNVKWDLMRDYYNKAKMTIIPTTATEGTSLSALESMACKTPVISTNVGGLCDLPTLKAETDPASIAEKMEILLDHWEEYAARQAEETRRIFNLHNWAKAWLQVVNEVHSSSLQ
jgi:glycosyltransferase involved in cell wall biosynthesis